jgi:GR25 family glycosyltransferase involved in LPS biosynthesis
MALTLKGKASRWQMFEQRTLPYLRGYNCVKYLGVDGRNMNNVYEAAASLFPEEKEKSFFERILKNREKYAGSTGCYLSHMMLWKYAMDTRTQGEEFVLVLEDDAKFEPYGVQNMERIMHELQDAEFDILYLGHSPHLKGTRITPLLLRPPSKSEPAFRTNCGFWGYIIRLASVPNLINSVSSFQDQSVDETIQRQYGELVDALFLISPIVTQSSLYSVRVTMDQGKALR